MKKPSLTSLLDTQEGLDAPAAPASGLTGPPTRPVHKPGDVNISAYFPREVKSALRQVQAKTGKNIKACLGEALAMLFRKYNVPVTVDDK